MVGVKPNISGTDLTISRSPQTAADFECLISKERTARNRLEMCITAQSRVPPKGTNQQSEEALIGKHPLARESFRTEGKNGHYPMRRWLLIFVRTRCHGVFLNDTARANRLAVQDSPITRGRTVEKNARNSAACSPSRESGVRADRIRRPALLPAWRGFRPGLRLPRWRRVGEPRK